MNHTVFCCPVCAETLIEEDGWSCPACKRTYPVTDGIVDLRTARTDYYFNPVPREEMAQLVEPVARADWPQRVRTFLEYVKGIPDWIDNLVVDGRYAWKLFLHLPEGARVLDLGCGLGNLAKNLAPNVGRLYAMDLTWERLQFARIRLSLSPYRDRVEFLAGGDGRRLPFGDDTLDAVFLSGVLEWVADDSSWVTDENGKVKKVLRMVLANFGDSNPRRRQLAFLKEIRRVLREDGQLFIAIENRLNSEYFRGRPDHHSGLKWGSLLPRLVSNLYSIAKNGQPYRTYTYSYLGYRRLLKAAGFAHQEFLALLPGYSGLSELVPLLGSVAFWLRPAPRTQRRRIASTALFAPAYGIVAGSDPAPRLIERLKTKVEAGLQLAEGDTLRFESFTVSAKDKGIVTARSANRHLVIRLPFNETALRAEERNHDMLERLRELGLATPRAVARGELSGVSYFVEECVEGGSVAGLWPDVSISQILPSVSRFLDGINPDLHRSLVVGPTREQFEAEVQLPLRRLREIVGTTLSQELATAASKRLLELLSRRGLTHGDFSTHNVFVHDGHLSGVIDWENARESIPALDAVNFLDSLHRLRNPSVDISDSVLLLWRREWPYRQELDFLQEQSRNSGLEDKDLSGLLAFYWLRHIDHQLESHAQYDVATLRTRTEKFLRFLREDPYFKQN